MHGYDQSISLTLPPLSVLYLQHNKPTTKKENAAGKKTTKRVPAKKKNSKSTMK